MDEVVKLIDRHYAKNEYGVSVEAGTEREVFAQISSVTRSEFFEAGRNGLNPEFIFTVFAGDYQGERICELHGKRYGIYRTYRSSNSDYIELYAERKGGTNG